ncbi:tctex1 domain-containing protein 1 [Aplysia californica]|uniref:Tctex1 domain-containing protein 1 n=1 Tax=Aplysia californica TaxID=6500 RepID=A0ABM1A489_APLCA|nr:tctex1 domain-containing protein 1 [Aplysia californica]
MATTGSHPAVKLKKLQLPPDTGHSGRRPSNPPSQPESTSTSGLLEPGAGFNAGRRRSTYRPGGNMNMVTATMALRRMTRNSIAQPQELPKPSVKYENTYRMEPEEGTVFLPSKAEKQISSLLEEHMKELTYDPATAGPLAETIAEAVKTKIKNLHCPRYKLVSTVMVGQCSGQGMEAASRCLWDDSKDNFATICHRNKSMFAVVTIFAAFFE